MKNDTADVYSGGPLQMWLLDTELSLGYLSIYLSVGVIDAF